MVTKQELRKSALATRKTLTEQECVRSDAGIAAMLIKELEFDAFDTFLFFYPLKGEVSLLSLAKQLLDVGKQLAFPRVHGDTMDFYRIRNLYSDFTEGSFHVMEPNTEDLADLSRSLCFVPGLVVDAQGYRVGYGKGYYDKYFSAHPNITKVGICRNRFFVPEIAHDSFDLPVDLVITETTAYRP